MDGWNGRDGMGERPLPSYIYFHWDEQHLSTNLVRGLYPFFLRISAVATHLYTSISGVSIFFENHSHEDEDSRCLPEQWQDHLGSQQASTTAAGNERLWTSR